MNICCVYKNTSKIKSDIKLKVLHQLKNSHKQTKRKDWND